MRRILLTSLAVASIAAFLPAHNARAEAGPRKGGACVSPTAWVGAVNRHSKGMNVSVLSDIAGMEAKAIVARINAIPPASDLQADHVIVLGARGQADDKPAPYVLVAFFSHDCLVTSGRADPRDTADMIGGVDI
jgi:hypothetical protein